MVPDSFYDLNVESRFLMMLTVDQQSTDEQRQEFKNSVRKMGYKEFLLSAYWRTVRDYVMAKHSRRCLSCLLAPATEVHHKSYEHHGQEHLYLADLMPVCRLCHEILQEKFDNRPADVIANGVERFNSYAAALLKIPSLTDFSAECGDSRMVEYWRRRGRLLAVRRGECSR